MRLNLLMLSIFKHSVLHFTLAGGEREDGFLHLDLDVFRRRGKSKKNKRRQQKQKTDKAAANRWLVCVCVCLFIVDMTLHLFEMTYKSVTELRMAQTR